ncbi:MULTISPECIES: DEAD/DEAH box helicase [unclassified Pseudomonas]|uniref:DEAD/DEAH box helicase n=1 Tax=Pseudomonas TaxID=286 RepID=UPI000D012550|nr:MULTISPECIES: DEAD/DEAH box helicase family protein [unclassified Pseudomonas]PRN02371.1 restriction endonuclease subunit R [Pseudomonas sp. LLC-1]PYG76808.1 type III restriction enzyme [Pseudomonas sp. RV120224-01c]PYG80172.1 type III restriction enzyme [Pseudomonas sp. RV120224-01b]
MAEPINGRRVANQITARLSLRKPQRESLDILVELLDQLPLGKEPDMQHWLQVIRSHYSSMQAFERAFPSLCFALATGVGKTRLMGAMVAWLFITGRSRHFLILAPNLTIYEKLKKDFRFGEPKYVFTGIPEMAGTPPVIITGDDYEDGRGVRLDYAVPKPLTMQGDMLNVEGALHINIFNIAKINARDNKKGATKSATAKVRRLQEYLGESYFDYLAGLPDLVVLMDEAHRYYADAGAKAIDDLKPVLGLELTATPKTTGVKPRPFSNVVYHYPLSKALQDGYVKIPAVGTRRDFNSDQYSPDVLESIKLEDGIHHHEFVKVELENYARNYGVKTIKPFMLVVAQDTAHASSIRGLIQSKKFFGGRYRDRVIEVHSNLSGSESDESTERLLAVEHDENTEIVIHVNKLKEGWDVTNLYTIVPLRASASEILTEQTLGRGLRLPYGKRTGVVAVDRLCIVAHDRFQEIVDRANLDDSLIHEKVYIGGESEADVPQKKPQLLPSSPITARISDESSASPAAEIQGRYQVQVKNAEEARVVAITLEALHEEARKLGTSLELQSRETQQRLVKRVQRVLENQLPVQPQLSGLQDIELQTAGELQALVLKVTEKIVALTIDVPRIAVLPTREVNYHFEDFDLVGLEKVRFEPVAKEILLHHLESNQSATILWDRQEATEARFEDYLVRHLFARDEVDYDQYAGLLYKLAAQMITHLKGYLSNTDAVENVLLYWQKQLSDFIWAQMQAHVRTTPTDYRGKVTQGFDVLKPAAYTLPAGDSPRYFRTPITEKRLVRQMVFEGFQRCCYPYQKFDSVDGEWRLAQILEDDPQVIRWMKPAPGQFRIEYQNGQNYEPDFIVETQDDYLMIEPKRADQIDLVDTQNKARAAERWCGYANEHAKINGGKCWVYLLVPDDQVRLGNSLTWLRNSFTY